MLALIAELYAVEREAKEAGLDETATLAVRQAQSLPVLARIKAWIDAEGEVVLPRSPMGTAVTYAKNQWNALTTYATQGFLNIDNNASERALKRVALGRKNSYDLLSTLQAHFSRSLSLRIFRWNYRCWRRAASPALHRRSIQLLFGDWLPQDEGTSRGLASIWLLALRRQRRGRRKPLTAMVAHR